MWSSRKSDAPPRISRGYTRIERGSIIIGRSAKPKSVRESSLYAMLPPRRHFPWRTETREYSWLSEGGRGFVPTLIIIGSFTKRTHFSPYRACTRPDATRRDGLYTVLNCIQPCGLWQTNEALRDANQGVVMISPENTFFWTLNYFHHLIAWSEFFFKSNCVWSVGRNNVTNSIG